MHEKPLFLVGTLKNRLLSALYAFCCVFYCIGEQNFAIEEKV